MILIHSDETLDKGDTLALIATVLPSNATNKTVAWESSDTDIATVDESGVVTAVGPGSATITATADGKSATCDVTVEVHASSVSIDNGPQTILDDETVQLTATVGPDDTTYPEVMWISSDVGVAAIDEDGLVSGVSPGCAILTATAEGKSDTCIITVNPSQNGTYDISKYGDDSVITLGEPLSAVTLTNAGDATFTNIQINCGSALALTLDNVDIDNSADADTCALAFTGSGNELILTGSSTLKSGMNEPGVRVDDTTVLEIYGSGTLDATSGKYGAGIGGGSGEVGGTIAISGGTVKAYGYDWSDGQDNGGAGIGGGSMGSNGTITISGDADVTAQGSPFGAGIGGGSKGSGGTVTITDNAAVTATGGHEAAGIVGGSKGAGGTITISGNADVTAQAGAYGAAGIGGGYEGGDSTIMITGDTEVEATGGAYGAGIGGGSKGGATITISGDADVTAQGDTWGPGIGGGAGSDGGVIKIEERAKVKATGGDEAAGIGGGTIEITGGIVYAIKGPGGSHDIGKGMDGSDGTINISGTAAVFLGTDSMSPASPETTIHTHYTFTEDTEEAYGIAVPGDWAPTFGAYLYPFTLSYSANGGTGTVPASVTQHIGTTIEVADGSSITKGSAINKGWDTQANGRGTTYQPGDTFIFEADTTLYVLWPSKPKPGATAKPTTTPIPTPTPTPTVEAMPEGALTSSPEPKATPTPEPTVSPTPAPAESDAPSASPSPAPTMIPVKKAEKDDKTGTVTVEIDVSALPEGAKAVQMPDGTVVEIGDGGTVEITISQDDLDDSGAIELILLDDEGLPLAPVVLQTAYETDTAPDTSGGQNGGRPVFIWLLIGLGGVGVIGGAAYLIIRKRGV